MCAQRYFDAISHPSYCTWSTMTYVWLRLFYIVLVLVQGDEGTNVRYGLPRLPTITRHNFRVKA